MPQDPLLRKPESVQDPRAEKPEVLEHLLHKLGVMTGLSEQAPGDTGDFLAASAGLLPIAAILKLLRSPKNLGDAALRSHKFVPPHLERSVKPEDLSLKLRREFGPVDQPQPPPEPPLVKPKLAKRKVR